MGNIGYALGGALIGAATILEIIRYLLLKHLWVTLSVDGLLTLLPGCFNTKEPSVAVRVVIAQSCIYTVPNSHLLYAAICTDYSTVVS